MDFFQAPQDVSSLLESETSCVPPSTKLVATLGPACRDVDTLCAMLEAGMQIARFDFSYGTPEWHQEALDNLRTAMARTHLMCATVMDTLGPEIVVINRPDEPILLEAGQTVVLTTDPTQRASSRCLPISYPSLAGTGLEPGRAVFVGQYLFTGSETTSAYLTVQAVDEAAGAVSCVVANACALEGVQLTVHVGNMRNEAPILAQRDKDAIASWAAPNAVDFLAVSYCRSASDVVAARKFLEETGASTIRVIAKIENKEGLAHYKEIVEASDGVIFSRGSMGNCLDPEKMFLAQKMLLAACNMAGKPVYVTRVVDTMTEAPRPTRAEATDVANAVLDGCDGIVLGSETFRGKFPVQAVETVGAICRQAERCFNATAYYNHVMETVGAHTLHPTVFNKTEALATAAVRASTKVDASLIVAFTVTGRTAALIAKYRPATPVLTVCTLRQPVSKEPAPGLAVVPLLSASGLSWAYTSERAARQCLALRGVLPVCVDGSEGQSLDDADVLRWALEHAVSVGLLKAGDRVVVSQCPRVNPRFKDTMAEAGTVKMLLVDEALAAGGSGPGGMEVGGASVRRVSSRLIGSAEVLQGMA